MKLVEKCAIIINKRLYVFKKLWLRISEERDDCLMRRLVMTISIICFCFGLLFITGCNSENIDYKKLFLTYYENEFDKYTFHTSDGTEMWVLDFEKEDVSRNPRVLLSLVVGISDDELKYQWFLKTPDERKSILKECSELVIDYAKANNWDNDYYLYIRVDQTNEFSSCYSIYDYEQDKVWISDMESVYTDMYQSYGTFCQSDIAEMEGGTDFLIENGFSTLKHGELETNHATNSYKVSILDGAFKEYDKEKSSCY